MISVVLTTYNHESYISRAIESILGQKCDDAIEIVIGDDCSTDGTMCICQEYAARYPNICYIRHKKNIGLIDNYRCTILNCHGEYIAWLDGDDYWCDEQKLQYQKCILEANIEIILTYSNKYILKGSGEKPIRDSSFAVDNVRDLLCANPICTPTVLCRTQYLKKYINEVCDIAIKRNWKTIDYPLWISMLRDYPHSFYYDANYTAVYRIVLNSGSHPQTKQIAYQWDKQVCDIKYYYWKNNAIADAKIAENIFHLRKRMLMQYGLLAFKQIGYLLGMIPYMYDIVLLWVKRKF